MKKVAIDLTWVRHNKVGGTESCIRNLLDGFSLIDTGDWEIILLLSKDNRESFQDYSSFKCFTFEICDVNSANQMKRVAWQNIKMGAFLRKKEISLCLEPVYGKPFFGTQKIDFITTIHDLQAIHYPMYFRKLRVLWMKLSWWNAVCSSKRIVTISNYVKTDLENLYPVARGKTRVIYDAVNIDQNNVSGDEILNKTGVNRGAYYYTVSSLFLHKNLKTVICAIAEMKKSGSKAYMPLVVTGIGGRNRNEIETVIEENNVKDDIIFTSFIDDAERNTLYQNCKAFLFPSIFEGFGMPPIEAMMMNTPVLTTKCTSIEEVTGSLLNYVDNPLDYYDWCNHLEKELIIPDKDKVEQLINRYKPAVIAKQYLELFEEIYEN